jgi:ATP-dependent Lhr-like helicase
VLVESLEVPDAENHREATPFVVALETLPRLLQTLETGSDLPIDLSKWILTDPSGDDPTQLDPKEILELLSTLPAAGGDAGPEVSVNLLSQWLRFYGPLDVAEVERSLPWPAEAVRRALEILVDDGVVVVDHLIESSAATQASPVKEASPVNEVCDVENLERLLRLARRERRPQIEALPLASLPLFLAVHQGVAPRRDGIEGLQSALDHLFGYSAPAQTWESDLLPSRLDPYHPAWLDSLMQDGELVWRGTGRQRLTFQFRADLDLLPTLAQGSSAPDDKDNESAAEEPARSAARISHPGPTAAADMLTLEGVPGEPEPATSYTSIPEGLDTQLLDVLDSERPASLRELSRRTGRHTGPLTDSLWQLAWRGLATNDTFLAVRRGLATGFVAEPTPEGAVIGTSRSRVRGHPSSRGLRSRWGNTRSFVGRWSRLPVAETVDQGSDLDPLEREEIQRERAHLVLQRYGIVFRELLQREHPGLRWGELFRSLRLMELSGEILSGHFFQGVPGLQFATPSAVRRLRRGLSEDLIYWISALDPSSPSALGLPLPYAPPRRLAGNHLVFHGSRLCLVSERRGRRLEILVPPEHPHLVDYLEPLRSQLGRSVDAVTSIEVDEINGEGARRSPYRPILAQEFQLTSGATSLRLWRRHR